MFGMVSGGVLTLSASSLVPTVIFLNFIFLLNKKKNIFKNVLQSLPTSLPYSSSSFPITFSLFLLPALPPIPGRKILSFFTFSPCFPGTLDFVMIWSAMNFAGITAEGVAR